MRVVKVVIFAAVISGVWYIACEQSGKGVDFEGGKTFVVGDTTSVEKESILTDGQQKEVDSFNNGFDSINHIIKINPVTKVK